MMIFICAVCACISTVYDDNTSCIAVAGMLIIILMLRPADTWWGGMFWTLDVGGESLGTRLRSRWYLVELLFTVPESGPMPFPLDDVIFSIGYSYVADSRD